MNMLLKNRRLGLIVSSATRSLSNTPAIVTPPPVVKSQGGSTLFQRLSAFVVGAGTGLSISFVLILNELKESNAKFEQKLASLEAKISK